MASVEALAHEQAAPFPLWDITRFILAAALTALAVFLELPTPLPLVLFVTAYALAGYKIIGRAIRNVGRGNFFDENFLMVVASLGAFAIRDFEEAVTVLVFFGVGEMLQDRAIARSKRSIAALMDIRPEQAYLISEDGSIVEVHPREVPVGALIQVRPGQRIPLDGVIVEGATYLDTRALTGESVPRSAGVGSEVLSGAVNLESTLTVRTTAEFGRSAASRILDLVQNAQSKKAQSEQFITRFARIYTPAVLAIAALVALIPPLLGWGPVDEWFYKALVFLVISCPCALVISIPLSFFGGIGGASKHGILVKGGNYLEALASTKVVVVDKTGTLTEGNFVVTSVEPTEGVDADRLLSWAASAESHSSHPIASSIVRHARERAVPIEDPEKISEFAGRGVVGLVDGHEVAVGSDEFLAQRSIKGAPLVSPASVLVARDGRYVGSISIEDEIRPHTAEALEALRAQGVDRLIMLTGDGKAVADQVGAQVGIDEVHAELMPEDKIVELERILATVTAPAQVAVVGDGINDAPMLSRGDIGIAMGGIGSEAAIQAADIVIMNDDVSLIGKAIDIARKTKRIVRQNIALALGIKVAIMALALLGITSIWFAIFADVGVALIALANALRASRV
jgi:Cd2+/Zn2+-exporting ATPase